MFCTFLITIVVLVANKGVAIPASADVVRLPDVDF